MFPRQTLCLASSVSCPTCPAALTHISGRPHFCAVYVYITSQLMSLYKIQSSAVKSFHLLSPKTAETCASNSNAVWLKSYISYFTGVQLNCFHTLPTQLNATSASFSFPGLWSRGATLKGNHWDMKLKGNIAYEWLWWVWQTEISVCKQYNQSLTVWLFFHTNTHRKHTSYGCREFTSDAFWKIKWQKLKIF